MKKFNNAFWWDLFFVSTGIGIWPRFIEPKLLCSTKISLNFPNIPSIKITQVSDLHYNEQISDRFLKKLLRRINAEKPHFIFFTGDFICRSKLQDSQRLKSFLESLKPSHGSFAVLGNHDYSEYVSINNNGDYDVFEEDKAPLNRGLKRFFKKYVLTTKSTERAQNLISHNELTKVLAECRIKLLQNEVATLLFENKRFNIVGLGEHMLNKANPELAFQSCDAQIPTIVLVHNPDAIPKLSNYPGNLILSGHTHGGQFNLPWIWKKICLLENPQYKRGLFFENGKWIYISRGVGGSPSLRFFSPPQITTFSLGNAL